MRKIVLILTLLTACLISNADDARDALIVQTVLKLETFDYEKSSEKVKGSIQRYLKKNLGSEVYFNLVDRFSIISQTDNNISLLLPVSCDIIRTCLLYTSDAADE